MSTDLPAIQDLEIMSGDTLAKDLAFIDPLGVPINLTTATFLSQVRLTADAADYVVQFAIDDTDAAIGEITISLTTAQTEAVLLAVKRLPNAVWDFQITLSGVTETYIKGDVYSIGDVSR